MAGPIEQRHLQLDAAAGDDGGGRRPGPIGDAVGDGDAGGTAAVQHFEGGVGAAHGPDKAGGAAGRPHLAGEKVEIDRATLGVQVEQALGQLHPFGKAEGETDAGDR